MNEFDMVVDHLDVATAFLNGLLAKTVFMEELECFGVDFENKICL